MLLTKMLQTFGEYLVLMGRVFSDVLETLREGDGRPWGRFDHYRLAHLVFHRRRYLHPDQTQHRKRLDAKMGEWLRHT